MSELAAKELHSTARYTLAVPGLACWPRKRIGILRPTAAPSTVGGVQPDVASTDRLTPDQQLADLQAVDRELFGLSLANLESPDRKRTNRYGTSGRGACCNGARSKCYRSQAADSDAAYLHGPNLRLGKYCSWRRGFVLHGICSFAWSMTESRCAPCLGIVQDACVSRCPVGPRTTADVIGPQLFVSGKTCTRTA
jgi:hypothetical protein